MIPCGGFFNTEGSVHSHPADDMSTPGLSKADIASAHYLKQKYECVVDVQHSVLECADLEKNKDIVLEEFFTMLLKKTDADSHSRVATCQIIIPESGITDAQDEILKRAEQRETERFRKLLGPKVTAGHSTSKGGIVEGEGFVQIF